MHSLRLACLDLSAVADNCSSLGTLSGEACASSHTGNVVYAHKCREQATAFKWQEAVLASSGKGNTTQTVATPTCAYKCDSS